MKIQALGIGEQEVVSGVGWRAFEQGGKLGELGGSCVGGPVGGQEGVCVCVCVCVCVWKGGGLAGWLAGSGDSQGLEEKSEGDRNGSGRRWQSTSFR
jgi:hypothetical protein